MFLLLMIFNDLSYGDYKLKKKYSLVYIIKIYEQVQ